MLGVLGTFCVFWSLSGLLLRLFLSVKKIYFRNLNSFTLRQLSSKINTNVFSVTVICILLFLVICILSSAMSLKKSLEKNLDDTAPVDIQIDKVIGETDESELSQNKIDSQKMTIEQVYQKGGCNLFDYLDEWAAVKVYSSPDLTFRDTMGSEFDEIKDSVSFMAGTSEMVVKVSEYNKIAELYGLETYTLKEDEYIMVADYTEVVRFRNMALQKGKKINVFGHELSPKYTECKEGFLQIGATHSNTGFLLVSDDIPDENSFSAEYLAGNYKANSKEERLEIDKKIAGMNKKLEKQDYIVPTCDTKNDITEASIGLGAMATFLGIYLGIIFLISCAAMLALKELAESVDNRERYETLRRLGADEKMISQALFKQIGTFFLLPLMLAVVHAVFGMKFSAAVLQSIGTSQISSSMLVTAGILVFVYGGYFVLTYLCGRKYIR
jgi:putative ABC transport system permease protein